MRDVKAESAAPPGVWVAVAMLAATLLLAALGRVPATQTARRHAEVALRRSLGVPVSFDRARYRPGTGIHIWGGRVGFADRPLEAGGSGGASPEVVEISDGLVHLPGGSRLDRAAGRLWREPAGSAFDLTGVFTGFGMQVARCRIQVRAGGRSIRVTQAVLLSAEPGGVKLGAAGVRVELTGTGEPITTWRGRVRAERIHIRGVPGAGLVAGIQVRSTGAWAVTNLQARLCDGALEGRAAYDPQAVGAPLALHARLQGAQLAHIPPSATAGAGGLEGWVDLTIDGALGRGRSAGRLVVAGRNLEFGEAPAFLALLRTLQFALSNTLRFHSLDLHAAIDPGGLAVERMELPGGSLSVRLAGAGRVGWGGELDLPLEVRGNRGVFGDLPVVGALLKPRDPIAVDVRLGGTLAAPQGRAGSPRRRGD